MPRDKKDRLIKRAPNFTGFRPFGMQTSTRSEVMLLLEEYEAIRLCDYDLLTHEAAARLMGISRATFSRVYETARRKVAKAMVEAAVIRFKGGSAIIDAEWFRCNRCKISFSLLPGSLQQCPFCKSGRLTQNT